MNKDSLTSILIPSSAVAFIVFLLAWAYNLTSEGLNARNFFNEEYVRLCKKSCSPYPIKDVNSKTKICTCWGVK